MKVRLALSLALLMLMTTTLAGCVSNDAEVLDVFHGDDLPSDDPEYDISEFSLIKPDGNVTNLSDYEGQVLIVSFIYSRCPDVCPVVSSNLRWVSQELADHSGNHSMLDYRPTSMSPPAVNPTVHPGDIIQIIWSTIRRRLSSWTKSTTNAFDGMTSIGSRRCSPKMFSN